MSVDEVLAGWDAVQGWQEDLYRHLHSHPELSFQELETADTVDRHLRRAGFAVQRVGGGVVGVLSTGTGPTVLARADMDALPVREATGLPYASTRTVTGADGGTLPVMHACGHDMHVAAAVGAAALLAGRPDAWRGTYIALFQPAEENAGGARAMLDAGLLDLVPRPDVCVAQHVLTAPDAGQVGTHAGPMLSTAASLRVTVHGTGSHGSMPHLSVDPVVIASAIVMRLQTIVAREVSPFDFAVVTVGSVQAGTSANIIPASASLLINIRAYDDGVRQHLVEAISRIVDAECRASRAPEAPEIEVYDTYPLTANDPEVTARVTRAFLDHFGPDRVVSDLPAVTASEDFSTIPTAFGSPYTYWAFGGFPAGQPTVPNHNPAFAPVILPTLRTGTEALVVAALAYLGESARAA
ncbi:MAG TPA: amidohydrolase [Propionibacteriaceae bacterium]|nr:amidohydrolase [Propionibacteriaceae bacterium]